MTVEPDVRARRQFFEQARELTPYVAAKYKGAVFVVPTDADDRFFVKQRRKDLRLLGQAVATAREHGASPGSTFVDVGAHIGTTTVSALAHHGFERGVAIEPDPDNLRLLRANVALNGLDERATVVAAAVSDAPGTASFTRRDPDSGPAYWSKGRIAEASAPNAVEVEVVTLDQSRRAGDSSTRPARASSGSTARSTSCRRCGRPRASSNSASRSSSRSAPRRSPRTARTSSCSQGTSASSTSAATAKPAGRGRGSPCSRRCRRSSSGARSRRR